MTKRINEQRKQLEQLRSETSYLESQIKEGERMALIQQERKISKTLPKLGKNVYIPKTCENYSQFLEGDVIVKEGGLAKVVKITPQMPFEITVSIKGDINDYRRFEKDYSWESLLPQQKNLKNIYGGKSALVNEGHYDLAVHHQEMTDLLDW